jgi:hypothetical protein
MQSLSALRRAVVPYLKTSIGRAALALAAAVVVGLFIHAARDAAQAQLKRDQIDAYNIGKELAILTYALTTKQAVGAQDPFVRAKEEEPRRRLSELGVFYDFQPAGLMLRDRSDLPGGIADLRARLEQEKDPSVEHAFYLGYRLQELLLFDFSEADLQSFIDRFLIGERRLELPPFAYPAPGQQIGRAAALSSALQAYQGRLERTRFPTE